MDKDIFQLNEKIAMMRYADIIDLPHHQSPQHPPMSMEKRAAQFGSFAAVSGHAEALAEYARPTEMQEELCLDQRQQLDNVLQELRAKQAEKPLVRMLYFIPDIHKEGGAYEEIITRISQVDEEAEAIVLETGVAIPFSRIIALDLYTNY